MWFNIIFGFVFKPFLKFKVSLLILLINRTLLLLSQILYNECAFFFYEHVKQVSLEVVHADEAIDKQYLKRAIVAKQQVRYSLPKLAN